MTPIRRATAFVVTAAGSAAIALQPGVKHTNPSRQRWESDLLGVVSCELHEQSTRAIFNLREFGLCTVARAYKPPSVLALRGLIADICDMPSGRESSRGRLHFNMLGHPSADLLEDQVITLIRPLVEAYLGESASLSQLQILDSLPEAQSQGWHLDNTAKGLTVLVPFSPGGVPIELGPTEILLGTRTLDEARRFGCKPLRATLETGDILIFDSRMWHRGLENSTSRSRRVLILRYDHPNSPPPGIGALGSIAILLAGKALASLQLSRLAFFEWDDYAL